MTTPPAAADSQATVEAPAAQAVAEIPAQNAAALKDLQVWHWWFFLRGFKVRYDPPEDSHWPLWQNALDEAVKWGGGWELSSVQRRAAAPPEQDYPLLFAKLDRRAVGRFQRSLQARALLDSTYIRVVWTLEGGGDLGDFSGMRDADWRFARPDPRQLSPPYLGDAICLLAKVSSAGRPAKQDQKQEQERQFEELSKQILSSWCKRAIEGVELIEFTCGYYATSHEADEMVWVLLLWDDAAAGNEAQHILVDLTPSFMLAWLKGRYIRKTYDSHILADANKVEYQLEKELGEVKASGQGLQSLEETNLNIIIPLDKLSLKIAKTREYLITLKINRDNLNRQLRDAVFKPGRARMRSFFVDPLSQSIQQIEVYLNYKQITQEQARERLDLNQIRVQIISQKDTRRVTVILGLFAIFGVIQAFDEEIRGRWSGVSFWIKLLIISVLLIFLLGYLLSSQDDDPNAPPK